MSNGLAVPLCLCALVPSVLAAQVGHEPDRSPFHDLTTRQGLSISIGRFAGNPGAAGVGARPGLLAALRFDTQLSGPADLWVSVGRIASSRYVIDATKDSATRRSGPIDMRIIAADLGLALNLTGPKTWRGIAPYVGLGIGVLSPTPARTDPGGYQAGTNFAFVPTIGTRVFIGRAVALRLEGRDYYFRYEWPLLYYTTPQDANGKELPPAVLDLTTPGKQWTHNFTLSVGLLYAFTF